MKNWWLLQLIILAISAGASLEVHSAAKAKCMGNNAEETIFNCRAADSVRLWSKDVQNAISCSGVTNIFDEVKDKMFNFMSYCRNQNAKQWCYQEPDQNQWNCSNL